MKKIFLFLVCTILVFSMSGCSDFGFNPTGEWKFVSDNVYDEERNLIDSALAEDNSILNDLLIVFEKSGTGYTSVTGIKVDEFTYSYDNDSISVTYLPNEYHEEITVEFKPSEDGKNIIRSVTTVENGVTYTEENLYKRI